MTPFSAVSGDQMRLAQIITGASYHFLASRNRLLETYGIDVNTREIRERHSNAVIDILFTGMLASAAGTARRID